jgi:hypothetical protein
MSGSKKISAPSTPLIKSALKDEVDEIYKNEDPIDVSLEIRKKSGNISNQVADKNAKAGKFFFTIRIKGD